MNNQGILGEIKHDGGGGLIIAVSDQTVNRSQLGWYRGFIDTLKAVGVKLEVTGTLSAH